MKINNISIVIPILNEEKNLIKLTNGIRNIKNKLKIKNFELIFIDDNSEDKTKTILKNLSLKNKFMKFFIRKEIIRDLSKSCILGFEKSRYQNILVMDGDLQHPPKFIEHLTKKYFKEKADFVIGSRNLLKKKNSGLSFLRYISSVVIIYVISFFLGKKTSDPLSGFFIFKKKIYKKNKNIVGIQIKHKTSDNSDLYIENNSSKIKLLKNLKIINGLIKKKKIKIY